MSTPEQARRRYERERHTVPGWLALADLRLIELVDHVQREVGIVGDLLEIGVYHGKTAILLGWLRRDAEELVLCDLFGAPADAAGNQGEADRWYAGLGRADFDRQWARHHDRPATVLECDSALLPDRLGDRRLRIVHVDGAHVEEAVRRDLETAVEFATTGAVIVVDDYRTAGLPGVAAALWPAVERGALRPVLFTEAKAYLVRGDDAVIGDRVLAAVLAAGFATSPIVLRQAEAVWIAETAPFLDRVAGVAGRVLNAGRRRGGRVRRAPRRH